MSDRLERLEGTAARLAEELATLRRELAALRGEAEPVTPPPPAPSRIEAFNAAMEASSGAGVEPPAPQPAARGPGPVRPAASWEEVFKTLGVAPPAAGTTAPRRDAPSRQGLEDLIGRYGILALAVLTILMGVGAFLGWAIRNGHIGPELRVALGALAAAVIAGVGWRMRKGDSPRFANVLLALSLAIVHVVAWGAGPRLLLVSSPVALLVAALASAVLAALAWRDDDQALFNVGFGGALLAPFVTSSGEGDAVVLLIYGGIVLGAGIASLRQRQWTKTPLVASAGVVAYTVVAAEIVEDSVQWTIANAPAIFAMAVSIWATLMLDGRKRMAITYIALLSALGALIAAANGESYERVLLPLAVALAGATYFAGSPERRGLRTALVSGVILPLGALGIGLASLADVRGLPGALVTLIFASLAAAAGWLNRDGERPTHAFTAALMLGGAIILAADGDQLTMCLGIAAFGAMSAWTMRRPLFSGVAVSGILWLMVGAAIAFTMLDNRAAYQYRPFLTEASLAAAAISASWLSFSWHASRLLSTASRLGQDLPRSVVRILGAVVAFLWIRQEFAEAWSRDVSAFLLAAYYALAGVAAIFLGRSRAIPLLRQAGLGLCVFAAVATIMESSTRDIGWKVASYIVVGAFLLGVAYWYRATGTKREDPASDRGAAEPAA